MFQVTLETVGIIDCFVSILEDNINKVILIEDIINFLEHRNHDLFNYSLFYKEYYMYSREHTSISNIIDHLNISKIIYNKMPFDEIQQLKNKMKYAVFCKMIYNNSIENIQQYGNDVNIKKLINGSFSFTEEYIKSKIILSILLIYMMCV